MRPPTRLIEPLKFGVSISIRSGVAATLSRLTRAVAPDSMTTLVRLAASSFATKATTRAAVNTSPEPFSNIGVSLVEDGLVVGALWLATQHPLLFGIALIVALFLMAWLLITLIAFLKAVFRRIGAWFAPAPAH